MENSVNQRIKNLIECKGFNINSFSSYVGVTQSTINAMFTKNTEPSSKTIIAILNAFPLLSAEWLLRGEGSMFKETKEQSAESNEGNTLVGNNNSAINQTIAPKKGLPARLIAAILRACPNQEEQDKIIKEIDDFNNQ